MRKSPLNYLITLTIGAVLWVLTAIFYGASFSESLMLAVSTPEEFSATFRKFLGIAAIIGIMVIFYWFYYGFKDSTAGDLVKAKKYWNSFFFFLIIVSVGLQLVFIYRNLQEGILTTDWLITFALFSLHTWIYYWICTYLFSPENVKYIPLFK